MPTGINKIDDRKPTVTKTAWKWLVKNKKLEVPWPVWKRIVEASNQMIAEKALEKHGFVLPLRLGMLIVSKRKPFRSDQQAPFLNLKIFQQTGVKSPQLNLHTFGYYYKLVYVPTKETSYGLHELWRFQAVRGVNRKLASLIQAGRDYFEQVYKFKDTYAS